MLDPRVKEALCRMADNFDKGLGQRGLDLWERELEGFDPQGVLAGIRAVMDDPAQKHFPRVAELKARIPRRHWPGDGSERKNPPWWSLDGSWGGDWSGAHDVERLSEFGRYARKHGDPHNVGPFLRFLEGLGADLSDPPNHLVPAEPHGGEAA